ncbi:zinc finger protein 554-like [Salarias fasciatus]|uniref:zinc finger protein 554-like n=1 Tax=Salarias fasciatus TaxID=181472 RepID=UPI001176780E|nr:zinc finger protein 554-like [Salarias fasciatus]
MSSAQALREFINQRLTAAAGEIFTAFQQTVVQYEEEIERQRRLLESSCSSETKLRRAELSQLHDSREEQLCKEATYCLEQQEPEPPLIKEEEEEAGLLQPKEEQEEPEPPQIEELGTSRGGEQLILKFESDSFKVPSVEDQSDLSEPEESPDTEQFLSQDSEVHHVKKHLDPESTGNAELKKISMFHSDGVEKIPESEKQDECGKPLYKETNREIVHKKHEECPNLRTVTDKKKTLCEICGKSYKRQNDLTVHMRSHTGEKPYSCKTCGKSFSRQSNLLVHMRRHTGEKPYSCETCGKKFGQHSVWKRHLRTHSGVKMYSCDICGRGFSMQGNLSVHIRTHTGEKPYCCKMCGKSFSLQCNLLRHIKTHAGQKLYSC